MAKDALERLFEDAMKSSNGSNSSQYSLEDQLDVDDDFLDAMSNSSKDILLSRIQKVDLDDEPVKDNFEDDIKSALDYNLVDESTQVAEETHIPNDEFKLEKVELDENENLSYNSRDDYLIEDNKEEEIEEEETEESEEPVVEHKRGRGRPRKKPLEETESSSKNSEPIAAKSSSNSSSMKDINSLNDFMDSLAKDLINELRESNYKTRNFNKKQMNVILDYLENKI